MTQEEQTQQLIAVLTDRFEPIEGRDDAAMLLAESDAPEAIRALLSVACDEREDELLQATAGEALAMIMVRRRLFQPDIVTRLTPLARSEFEGLIANQRPEWLP